jgi:alpha-L-fucosidase
MRYFLIFLLLICIPCFAQENETRVYLPTEESLSTHETPAWYGNAKLGIFIHWGLYSVPGWATPTTTPDKVTDWKDFYKNNPYAEWYLNTLRINGSPTQTHHKKVYGEDFDYYQFAASFNEQNKKWNAQTWVSLFKEIGAKYIVVTTKHSDGFTLFPSRITHPFMEKSSINSVRDLIGELHSEARKQNLKFGVYYSGGLDWSFYTSPITNLWPDLFKSMPPSIAYTAYVDNHYYELIHRYKPDVIWNDVNFPASGDMLGIMAELINHNSNAVFNNRWNSGLSQQTLLTLTDFDTPEYAVNDSITKRKWETCRGIGYSFGYNQNETDEHLLSSDALIDMFIDIVSKNGNLLLNIGPRADGSIPENQLKRLTDLGNWMKVNSEAIYDTTPWKIASTTLADGTRVRFTKKENSLFIFLLDAPKSTTLFLPNISISQKSKVIQFTNKNTLLKWKTKNNGIEIKLNSKEHSFASVIEIAEP